MNMLLHICCGICATSVVERLMMQGYRVTGFFYNPNIHPTDEYYKRLETAKKVAEKMDFELIESPYDRERWFETVKGLEYEPEGGKRCNACIKMRLEKTYEYLKKKGIYYKEFTTTLTVSPLKDVTLVNDIGGEIGGDKFYRADFKKKGGFQRAIEMAKEFGLERQNYCGCLYSLEEGLKKEQGSRLKGQDKDEKTQ
jgi:epoxyqueuosine reductase